jgi:purine-binding chemotaxis protein CheW
MKDKDMSRKKKQSIDWDKVHKRLEAVRVTVERGWMPTPEEKKNVLRERAKALAQEAQQDDSGKKIEVIEFLLAYERYGVESSFVREVYPLKDLTPVPCTPSYVFGIINIRGQILSIIDLKKFFDLPDKGLGDLNKVIILKSDTMEFGILADIVLEVRKIRLDELQPSLPTLTGIREEYLKGIAKDRTVILDAEKLLADEKLSVNEET